MVVPVLITSCQVSLKWNIGPETIHAITIPSASRNAAGRPVNVAVFFAKRENQERDLVGRMLTRSMIRATHSAADVRAVVVRRDDPWEFAYADGAASAPRLLARLSIQRTSSGRTRFIQWRDSSARDEPVSFPVSLTDSSSACEATISSQVGFPPAIAAAQSSVCASLCIGNSPDFIVEPSTCGGILPRAQRAFRQRVDTSTALTSMI